MKNTLLILIIKLKIYIIIFKLYNKICYLLFKNKIL